MVSLLWFIFLFVLFFLGDGKQEIVDVVAAAGILCLFVVRRMMGKPVRSLPRALSFAWGGLLAYLVIRTAFSDSVGYSITATLRWVMAYLVFVFFYSAYEKKSEDRYEQMLLWFGALVVAASVVFTLFEPLGRALPGMNLLYPTFGHNHVANILILVFPIALYRRPLLALFFGAALVFSFARGAWLLMGGFALYFLLATRAIPTRIKLAGFGAVLVGVVTLFLLPSFSTHLPSGISSSPLFRRQAIKESIIASRLQYWKQAALAIQERPIFGAGPGTFYLLSKRFQEAPSTYSWFAHSFPLELLSEVGVVGFVGVMWLFGHILRRARRGPLFHGVVLTLIYSLYEMNLNFLVIWLLLWASLGTLFRTGLARHKKNYLLTICLAILVLFYISSVAASILGLFPGLRTRAFYSEPYLVGRAKSMLVDEKFVLPRELRLIEFFHKKDPEVLVGMAKQLEKKDPSRSMQLFEEAILGDKTNVEYWKLYIQLAQLQPALLFQNAIKSYILTYGGSVLQQQVSDITNEEIMYLVDFLNPAYIPDKNFQRNNLVRMFYSLGLSSLTKNPERTKMWWTLARESSPNWSYIHIELASLVYYALHDSKDAQKNLEYCITFPFASEHCKAVSFDSLPLPGSYAKQMGAIPEVIDVREYSVN